MQTNKVKGESQTLEYRPGERLKESRPPDEGIYQFALGENRNLKGIGKGWKAKPGKYPNRLVFFKALDTEDEISGKEKECREIVSLSPGALRRGIMRLAQASQYPLKLQIGPDKQPNHPTVKANAIAIDKMLMHIKGEELVLRGEVSHEEYNGEKQGRIKWLPPEDLDEVAAEEPAEDGETAEAAADNDVFGGDDSGDEEVAEDEPQAEGVEASADDIEDAEVVEDEAPVDEEFDAVPPPRKSVNGKAAKTMQTAVSKKKAAAPLKKKK